MGRLPSAGNNSYAHLYKSERKGRRLILPNRIPFKATSEVQRCSPCSSRQLLSFGLVRLQLKWARGRGSIGSLQIPAAVPSLHGRTIDLEQHHLELCKVRNLFAAVGPA